MFYSPTWKSQLGYRDEDLASSLETWEKLVHPDDRAPTLHQVEAYLAGDTEIFEIPMRMRHRDGHWVHILSRGSLVRGHDGSPSMPRRLVGLHVDLTAFKKMQADVLESETRFRTLFEKAMTGMAVADPKGNLTEANEQLARLLGYSRGELLGKNISAFTHPEDLASELVFLQEISNDLRDDYRIEKRYVTRSGEILWVDLLVTVLRDQERKATSVIGLVVDITERKASETRIIHLAYYDPLTDLPNRRLMQERLAHAVSTSERQGMFGALLMIDLDNFKTLNDTLGHDIGDQLLIQAAQRLRRCVRDSDTVSRLGGDEFMVILEHLDVRELAAIHSAEIVAAKILSEFSVAYSLELGVSSLGNSSRNHFCSCSIGITLFYGRGVKTEELLKRADTAMYQAKSAGRNGDVRISVCEARGDFSTVTAAEGPFRP